MVKRPFGGNVGKKKSLFICLIYWNVATWIEFNWKINVECFAILTRDTIFALAFQKQLRFDSLAQLVEHNTFNVGVLGSSPKRITKESESYTKVTLFFYALNSPVYMVQLNRELNQEWIFRISFPKYSWRISLSLQLPLESSKHLCPHALTANITS